jgi:hypothetical protein
MTFIQPTYATTLSRFDMYLRIWNIEQEWVL